MKDKLKEFVTLSLDKKKLGRVMAARRAHNAEIDGSSPV
ncbi:hypothetical protein LCGC14_2898410, partial [marine sediment metagenome]